MIDERERYSQVGEEVPRMTVGVLKSAFTAVQVLVDKGLVSAGHDRSDGGLVVTLIEMVCEERERGGEGERGREGGEGEGGKR